MSLREGPIYDTATRPSVGQINRYDASATDLAVTLPALEDSALGAPMMLQKDPSDTTVNTITFTALDLDVFDDTTTELALSSPGSAYTLQVVSLSGTKYWKVMGFLPGTAGVGTATINVRDAPFNAVGDGVTDDTDAIEAAWDAGDGALYFPPGTYLYNGTGLDHASPVITGAGGYQSTIVLGATSYLLKPSVQMGRLMLRDMIINNGKGAINHTYTGDDTIGAFTVERTKFYNYTECGISTESSDMPWWWIDSCEFTSANTTSTIGVAMSPGLTDDCIITRCQFNNNRVHVKAGKGGNNLHISETSFLNYSTTNSSGPRINVWLIPDDDTTNSGNGFTTTRCKMGSEGLVNGDHKFVYADAGSGSSNGTKFPNLAADSTGYVMGHLISDTLFGIHGSTPGPIVYSTTPNVFDCAYKDLQFTGNVPSYILQFRTADATPSLYDHGNKFGPFYTSSVLTATLGPPISNRNGVGYTDDPNDVLQTRPSNVVRRHGSGSSSSYAELLTAAIPAFGVVSATNTAATDAYGGSDAGTINYSATNGYTYGGTLAAMTVGKPVWIELDMKQPADTPVTSVKLELWDGGSNHHWMKTVEVPSTAMGWVTYAFSFTPRTTGTPYLVVHANGSTGKVIIGRPRVYHSHERVLGGRRPTIAAAGSSTGTTQTLANDIRDKLIALGLVKA